MPNRDISPNWLLARIDEALYKQKKLQGSIQINCPYNAPFYGGDIKASFPEYTKSIAEWMQSNEPYVQHVILSENSCCPVQLPADIWEQKGIILVGAIAQSEQTKVLAFSLATGWPIFADIQSGINSAWHSYDLWLQGVDKEKIEAIDVVIQFGTRLVSPIFNKLFAYRYQLDYYLIDPIIDNKEPTHRAIHYCHMQPSQWIKAQDKFAYSQCSQAHWGDELMLNAQKCIDYINTKESNEVTMVRLADNLMSKEDGLFLGNSTLVRLFNTFSTHAYSHVYANRGASGIDGLIATAVGVASGKREQHQSFCAFVGDLSALHDLNSLALLHHFPHNFVLVISNNSGGAIFDRFPIEDEMNDLYQMYHGFHFQHAANMFDIPYHTTQNLRDFQQYFTQALDRQGPSIIEFTSEPKITHNLVEQLQEKIKRSERLTLVKE